MVVNVAMGQIPRSTERISSWLIILKILIDFKKTSVQKITKQNTTLSLQSKWIYISNAFSSDLWIETVQ